MTKFTLDHQPLLRFLKEEDILKIHEAALKVLAKTGVFFDSEEALTILRDAGCSVDFDQKIARFPKELVEKALSSVPETF